MKLSSMIKKSLQWIKNNLLVVALIGLVFYQWNDTARQLSSINNVVEQRDSILFKKINDMGQKVVTATAKTYEERQLKLLTKVDERFKSLDNRLKSNGRKINDLESSVSFKMSAQGEGLATPIETSVLPQWKYKDPIMSIDSQLNPDNQLFMKWTLRPQKLYVDLFAKGRFLRGPIYTADISADSPNIDFTDTNIFMKKAPKPFLVFGAGVGLTLAPDLSIKPGMQLSAIKPIYTIYK